MTGPLALAAGVVALLVGCAYLGMGLITGYELLTRWRSHGPSRFGLAFLVMALTCGPHHLVHGTHVLFEGHALPVGAAGALLLAAAPGAAFVLLRLEVLTGGTGERFVPGTPTWLAGAPWAAALVTGGVLALTAQQVARDGLPVAGWPSVLLALAYGAVGWLMVRTQLAQRQLRGGWSLSRLSLAAIFPTCALAHLALAPYADGHLFAVDVLGLPAAALYLWVTAQLYREGARDWNRLPVVGHALPTARRSPWAAATR